MNERAIRKIYQKYAALNRDTQFKPHNGDWIIMQDCYALFKEDTPLNLTYKTIHEAFALSKKQIVNEFDSDSLMQYHKLSYVEFLEFLARIAVLYFEGSEMEELELHEKLEYLLDEILPIIEAKRVK